MIVGYCSVRLNELAGSVKREPFCRNCIDIVSLPNHPVVPVYISEFIGELSVHNKLNDGDSNQILVIFG